MPNEKKASLPSGTAAAFARKARALDGNANEKRNAAGFGNRGSADQMKVDTDEVAPAPACTAYIGKQKFDYRANRDVLRQDSNASQTVAEQKGIRPDVTITRN